MCALRLGSQTDTAFPAWLRENSLGRFSLDFARELEKCRPGALFAQQIMHLTGPVRNRLLKRYVCCVCVLCVCQAGHCGTDEVITHCCLHRASKEERLKARKVTEYMREAIDVANTMYQLLRTYDDRPLDAHTYLPLPFPSLLLLLGVPVSVSL